MQGLSRLRRKYLDVEIIATKCSRTEMGGKVHKFWRSSSCVDVHTRITDRFL